MSDPQPDVMTVAEVSEYLRLTESTVYRLVRTQEIPGRKIGGTWRFSRQQLESWLASSSTNSQKDGAPSA